MTSTLSKWKTINVSNTSAGNETKPEKSHLVNNGETRPGAAGVKQNRKKSKRKPKKRTPKRKRPKRKPSKKGKKCKSC